MDENAQSLQTRIEACQICSARFAATATAHAPRPVVWFRPNARILIAGQAPGLRVHQSGRPFTDPSGDRLRAWLGISEEVFYDRERVAVVPMGFCFPGYNERKADLPPPAICARTWHPEVMQSFSNLRLRVLIGAHAQRWHLQHKGPVSQLVEGWRDHAPEVFPLPHPSWRNNAWLEKNPWFEAELLPVLQQRVQTVLGERA